MQPITNVNSNVNLQCGLTQSIVKNLKSSAQILQKSSNSVFQLPVSLFIMKSVALICLNRLDQVFIPIMKGMLIMTYLLLRQMLEKNINILSLVDNLLHLLTSNSTMVSTIKLPSQNVSLVIFSLRSFHGVNSVWEKHNPYQLNLHQ